MKYISFRIQNYKAIKDLTVNVKDGLNPIIGINEAGKSTILQAIADFGNFEIDSQAIHQYLSHQDTCSVTATIECSHKEIKEIGIEEFKSAFASDEAQKYISSVLNKKQSTYQVKIKRCLKNGSYSICNNGIVRLPKIVVFDESKSLSSVEFKYSNDRHNTCQWFNDICTKILINTKYAKTRDKYKNNEAQFWQCINNKDYLNALLVARNDSNLDENLFQDLQKAINHELNQNIINDWQEYFAAENSNIESDKLTISLNYYEKDDHFKVTCTDNYIAAPHAIKQRSAGLSWFINFMLQIGFLENSLILLDEPGMHLHAMAQEGLLKKLKHISNDNNSSVIYATHSHSLLNPKFINPSSIQVAKKENGEITLAALSKNGDVSYDKNIALGHMYKALGVTYEIFNTMADKIIITEGITDFYLFSMFLDLIDDNSLKIGFLGVTGATNESQLIPLFLAAKKPFLCLFDEDDAGRRSRNKIARDYYDMIPAVTYKDIMQQDFDKFCTNEQTLMLEDLINEAEAKKIAKEIGERYDGNESIKRLIPFMYRYYYSNQNTNGIKIKEIMPQTLAIVKKVIHLLSQELASRNY